MKRSIFKGKDRKERYWRDILVLLLELLALEGRDDILVSLAAVCSGGLRVFIAHEI